MRKLNFKLHKRGLGIALTLGLILVVVTAVVVPMVAAGASSDVTAYVNKLTGEVRIQSADTFTLSKALVLSPLSWQQVTWGVVGPAGPAGPAGTTVNYRAGTATISSGSSNVVVTMSSALPNTNYAVQLTFTGTARDFGDGSENVPLLYVSGKTTTQFTITIRNRDAVEFHPQPHAAVSVDWTAIAYQ